MSTKKTTAKTTTKNIKQALYSELIARYGLTKTVTIASVSVGISVAFASASVALLANVIPNNPTDMEG